MLHNSAITLVARRGSNKWKVANVENHTRENEHADRWREAGEERRRWGEFYVEELANINMGAGKSKICTI